LANGLISLGDHEFRFGILVGLRLVESLHAALGTNNLMAILIRLRLALTQIDGKDHAIVTRRTHDRGVPLTGYRLPCHDRPPMREIRRLGSLSIKREVYTVAYRGDWIRGDCDSDWEARRNFYEPGVAAIQCLGG